MAKILPSIFGADLLNLQEEINFLEKENVEILHIDLMDGNFVSHIAFGAAQISTIKNSTDMAIDVHMMTADPVRHLDSVLNTGAEMISVHYESSPHTRLLIEKIKNCGRKAGVVLNPATSEEVLKYLLDDIDYVLVMSRNPGEPSGKFIPSTITKIRNIRDMVKGYNISIEVDGGIDAVLARECINNGADLVVVGGSLFNGNEEENYKNLSKQIRD
ncbi:ribulose-phosphate 3-epimerase [Tetragenococcus halophilus]|uniref:ribulose-phosphate 3-epimerase n=1 Tax=Tetragenococcus halophilus TaxID=51669 RepID=UPI0015BE8F90|nr:ribulose-phosphate 3-epimerase [Tetragenococcus halophilus]NWN99652.1 ribulose-phosphate 3-epimerase [Tetragenococcus halophilus]